MEKSEVSSTEQKVLEKRIWNQANFAISALIFIVIVIIFIVLTVLMNLDVITLAMIACFFIVIYAVILFFLLEPKLLREVHRTTIQTIEKPVERIVERPVERQVQNTLLLEKPSPITHEIEKRIYISPGKTKSLSIPKYAFIGSSQTKSYHKRNCRLGKLIKKKYKMHSNQESFFIKKRFKPCEVCILKHKKV